MQPGLSNIDVNQTPKIAASDLGLHYLPSNCVVLDTHIDTRPAPVFCDQTFILIILFDIATKIKPYVFIGIE